MTTDHLRFRNVQQKNRPVRASLGEVVVVRASRLHANGQRQQFGTGAHAGCRQAGRQQLSAEARSLGSAINPRAARLTQRSFFRLLSFSR